MNMAIAAPERAAFKNIIFEISNNSRLANAVISNLFPTPFHTAAFPAVQTAKLALTGTKTAGRRYYPMAAFSISEGLIHAQ